MYKELFLTFLKNKSSVSLKAEKSRNVHLVQRVQIVRSRFYTISEIGNGNNGKNVHRRSLIATTRPETLLSQRALELLLCKLHIHSV